MDPELIAEQDSQWLWFLYLVCERLLIERADIEQGIVFYAMKDCYDKE